MRESKKIALSAIVAALGVVVMLLGALIETIDLTVAAISSLLIVFVYLEIGSPYTWLTWLCTSLCTLLLFPAKPIGFEYLLIFGAYPLIKGYIERLPRLLWLPVKIVYLNAAFAAVVGLCAWIFKIPFFEQDVLWFKILIFALATAAFIAYDLLITVSVRVYYARIRERIAKYLK